MGLSFFYLRPNAGGNLEARREFELGTVGGHAL